MDLLDEDFATDKPNIVWDAVKWWEKKRLIYNSILLLTELTMMLVFIDGTIIFGVAEAIFQSVLYTLVANVIYCTGWSSEILMEFYFKNSKTIRRYRTPFLIMGILFSIFLTIWSYGETLAPLDYFN